MDNQRVKYCITIMGVTVVSCLFAIAIFNILMDPYQLFGVPVQHRPMYLVDKSYLTKAVNLIGNDSDTLLIGSSIVDAAFKLEGSESAIYERDYFNEKMQQLKAKLPHDATIYNAGIRNGGLNDAYHYLQHAYQNNPHLKHVILGMEWNLFTYTRRANDLVPVVAPLGKTYVPFLFYVNNTLTWQATEDAWQVMLYRIKMAIHHPYLLFERESIDPIDALKEINANLKNVYIQSRARFFHHYTAQPIIYHDLEQHLVQGQTQQELASLLFSIWSLSQVKSTLDSVGTISMLNPEAFTTMRNIAAFAKQHHLTLDIYISPQHAVYWEIADKYGLRPYIDTWLKQLAMITPYWEFSHVIDFNAKVDHYFTYDALHFNPNAAEIILPVIMRGHHKMKPGIHYVTKKNVDAVLRERHADEAHWLKQNRYMQAILNDRDFVKTMEIKGDLDKVISVEYWPSFHDYHMLKFMGNFMALPVNEAPYDFKLLFTKKYKQIVTGKSVEDLMSKISLK